MHPFVLALLLLSDIASYRQAAALVDSAVAARGGSLAPIAFRVDATVRQLHQSPTPSGPYLETGLAQTITADPGARTFVVDETSVWPEFTSRTTLRIVRQDVSTIRHTNGTHSVTSDGADAAIARIVRRHPDLLLDAALRRRASVRVVEPDRVRIVLDDGGVITATFRQTTLIAIEWIAYHDVFGDVTYRIDYEWKDGHPVGFRQFENGQLAITARYTDTRRGRQVVVPPVAIPMESRPAQPPAMGTPRIDELALNVFLLRNAGGPDYHSLIVRFADRLVVVEAPRSPQLARAAIAAIKSWDSQRRIDRLVITHHHDDHIGGIRGYAEAGARVVTTPGNVAMTRALLEAPHTINPAAQVVADVAAVLSGERMSDDTNELVMLNPGPNDHVSESLVAWLPRQGILFQGDLFRHDPGRPEAARNAAVALSEYITSQKLRVKMIAGVHGEPASIADLQSAVRRRDAAQ